jgi:hypothetical protein
VEILTTVYSCGHTSDKRVSGEGDRTWRCDDMCVACRRPVEAEYHREEAIAEGWPALPGTPRQVAYAMDLRFRLVADRSIYRRCTAIARTTTAEEVTTRGPAEQLVSPIV